MCGPLSKLFKEFNSMQNFGRHANQKEKLLKNLLVKYYISNAQLIKSLLGAHAVLMVLLLLALYTCIMYTYYLNRSRLGLLTIMI